MAKVFSRPASCVFALSIWCATQATAQAVGVAQSYGNRKATLTQASSQQSSTTTRPEDLSSWLGFLAAFEAGGGWQSGSSAPRAYAGIKFGLPLLAVSNKRAFDLTLDLAYDRAQGKDGASAELSVMLPLFRAPGPQQDQKRNYLRIYAEPGLGYRFGGLPGGYTSTKLMMVFFSDYRLTASGTHMSPFIEVQRRFPFGSPLEGDNLFAIGLMMAVCKDCGVD